MCIFCKIIDGEIPSYKIYEDEDFLAFLDISQAGLGHTLVVPKEHFDSILEMPEELLSRQMVLVSKITKHLNEVLHADGFNILNNCKEAAGQSVMHFHIHIIPRYKGDDLKIEFKEHKIDLGELCEKLKLN